MSVNFGQIRPRITELAALERLKYRCLHFFSVTNGQIHLKFAGKENMHINWNEFEFRLDPTTDFEVNCLECQKYPHRVLMGKTMSPLFLYCFWCYFFILADNEAMHKSLDEFEYRPDPIAAHSHLKIRRHHFFSAANN